jgi:hypothetical protein
MHDGEDTRFGEDVLRALRQQRDAFEEPKPNEERAIFGLFEKALRAARVLHSWEIDDILCGVLRAPMSPHAVAKRFGTEMPAVCERPGPRASGVWGGTCIHAIDGALLIARLAHFGLDISPAGHRIIEMACQALPKRGEPMLQRHTHLLWFRQEYGRMQDQAAALPRADREEAWVTPTGHRVTVHDTLLLVRKPKR